MIPLVVRSGSGDTLGGEGVVEGMVVVIPLVVKDSCDFFSTWHKRYNSERRITTFSIWHPL